MCRRFTLALASVLVGSFVALAIGPDSIEGSWRLVEQRYERGGHNFAAGGESLFLRLELRTDRLAGDVRWPGGRADWPAYVTPGGPAQIDDVSVEVGGDRRSAEARYLVLPPPNDDTSLRVTERYRLDRDGRLIGDIEIRFERDGEDRGGFQWRRVFVRERDR